MRVIRERKNINWLKTMLNLVFPNKSHKEMYEKLIKEWWEKSAPETLFCADTFEWFLDLIEQDLVWRDNRVKSHFYFLFDDEIKDDIIGWIQIRHKISLIKISTEIKIEMWHIWYWIAPKFRKKGYATKMLKLALDKIKELWLDIDKVLITCDVDNIASAKVIENNGWIFEKVNLRNKKKILDKFIIIKTMKITYHSHSFVEIILASWSILIDPFITGNSTINSKLDDFLNKKILAVILTHWHKDHIWDTEIICKNTGSLLISTFEISNYFKIVKWLTNLHSMYIWWEFDFWDYRVKYVLAVHGWWVADMVSGYTTTPAWVVIRSEWKNIYHAWDTWLTYDMKLLSEYDNIDLAFLPIWWNFTMWIDDAVIATKDFIKPKKVVPIHYNTFWSIKANPQEFIDKVWKIGIMLNYWESIKI